jgi:hypothetical protein
MDADRKLVVFWSCFVFFSFLLLSNTSYGQSVIDQYNKSLRPTADIQPLTNDLFGDQISLLDGGLSFQQIDISLGANHGLPVRLGRTLSIQDQAADQQGRNTATHAGNAPFGMMWDLDVPYLKMVGDAREGWIGGDHSNLRCSRGEILPYVNGMFLWSNIIYETWDYHGGITANIPGYGSESLLNPPVGFANEMPADGNTYYKVTRSHWRARCVPLAAGGSGEGFAIVLPDGATYRFDWLASRPTANLLDVSCHTEDGQGVLASRQAHTYWGGYVVPTQCATQVVVPRSVYYLFATEATDRFGNYVRYNYDPVNPHRLLSIQSSDGNTISMTYTSSGQIETATANGRVWRYVYESFNSLQRLREVIQPDQSKWSFEYGSDYKELHVSTPKVMWAGCELNIETKSSFVSPTTWSWIRMNHPSGARGEFKIRPLIHGTKQTQDEPRRCEVITHGSFVGFSKYPLLDGPPSAYLTSSLFEKTISGPGLATQTWTYTYSPGWVPPFIAETTVQGSDGKVQRYRFGTDKSTNYGQLLQETHGDQGSTLRTINYTYASTVQGQNYPGIPGGEMSSRTYGWAGAFMNSNRPLVQKEIIQDGRKFVWKINQGCLQSTAYCYDAYLRPLSITTNSEPH